MLLRIQTFSNFLLPHSCQVFVLLLVASWFQGSCHSRRHRTYIQIRKKEEGWATLSSLLPIPFIRKAKTFREDSAKFHWLELGHMVTTKDSKSPRKQKSSRGMRLPDNNSLPQRQIFRQLRSQHEILENLRVLVYLVTYLLTLSVHIFMDEQIISLQEN